MNRASTSPRSRLAATWSFVSRLLSCAALLGLFALPFVSSLVAAALTTLLALPFALGAMLLVAVLARTPLAALGRRSGFAAWVCVATIGGLVFALGAYIANVALVDDPLQFATLVGCGIAGVAALVAMLVARYALRRSRLGPVLSALPAERVFAPVALVAGLGLIVLDSTFLSEGYVSFHLALFGLAMTCLAAWATIGVSSTRARRVVPWFSLAIFAASTIAILAVPLDTTYVTIANSSALDRRLLLLARRALDRDGDGFAAVLGGGDCDDRDRNAYPLSNEGRDCLRWVGGQPRATPLPPPSPTPTSASLGPRVILLVTVDALRCEGLSSPTFAAQPPLCPHLQQLATEGRQRVPAYTTYPSTAHATMSLHTGSYYPEEGSGRALLARLMKAHGRATHAVSTHAKQMPGMIAASFDSVDRTLQARTSDGSASTSAQVTERTLAWLRGQRERPVFVWVHYYDPHSPYVDPPGSHSALAPAATRYAAEVRRTEREVARLIRAAAAQEPDLFALITADHGEEFAEHGNMYHGTTLYEAAVRVPMIAWPVTASLPAARGDLPVSLAEVSPFLVSIARGDAFVSQNEAFFWVASQGKRLLGVYRDSYKLTYDEGLNLVALYNVAEDPRETDNLAPSRPGLRDELGARLTAYLARRTGEGPPDRRR